MGGERRPTLRDRIESQLFRGVLRGLRALGPVRGRRLGVALGSFMARFVPLRRQVALENLSHAFPQLGEGERREIYGNLFRHLGRVMADFPRLPHLDAEALLEEVDVEGGAHIREVASRGQGALLLTGHFGNWEYLGALIPSLGGSLTVMGADQRNPLVGDLFEELRQRPGIETVSRERGLRALVKALRSGRLVASLADQDGGKGGFFLDFFGRPASVQGGLFRLAARLGVPMVTGFLWFEEGRWQARYDSPVETSPPGDEAAIEEEARRLALVYTRRLEQHIRAHPEQWFWVHRRWKTAPPGEAQRPGDVGR